MSAQERFNIPGVSIVQKVELQASHVAYLEDTESLLIGDWMEASGDTVSIGTNMIEVIKYSDATGATAVAGFSRVELPAKTEVIHNTFTDLLREVTLNLKGILFKKNVEPAADFAYLENIAPHPTGIQKATSGKMCIGKTLMPITREKWGLVYADLIHQYEVA